MNLTATTVDAHLHGRAAKPVIHLEQAAFGYAGVTRVEDLTLDLYAGEALALIGPNGSGKSTLLRGLLGLADLTAGSATVLGADPVRARRQIGVLPQSGNRDHDLPITVRQVVSMGLYRARGAFGPIGASGKAAVSQVIARVGLAAFEKRRYGDLSGGQQQRAILARALVADPGILLLDEPFNGLDRENRGTLLELIHEFRAEGRSVVVSTHDLEIAREACSHVLLLATGHTADQAGHPAGFGPLSEALTLEAVEHAFQDATVELDHHTVTTNRETE